MVFDTVKKLVVEQLEADPALITPETNLMKDLEADSLDAVEVILGVEEAFGIEIPDEDAEKFETIQDIVDYIEAHK